MFVRILMRLAHFEDYCTQNSDGVFTVRPRVAPGDQWAPYAGPVLGRSLFEPG